MSKQLVQHLQEGFQLFAQGKFDRLAQDFFHADAEWVEPDAEGYVFAGTRRSFRAVVDEIFSQIPRHYSEFRVEPDQFLDGGETIVVTGRFVGAAKSTGERFEIPFCQLYTYRGDKIARARNYTDTASHIRALGGELTAA